MFTTIETFILELLGFKPITVTIMRYHKGKSSLPPVGAVAPAPYAPVEDAIDRYRRLNDLAITNEIIYGDPEDDDL